MTDLCSQARWRGSDGGLGEELDGVGGDHAVEIEEGVHLALHLGHAENVFGTEPGTEVGRGLDHLRREDDDFFDAVDDEREAGELNGFAGTHITNKCYDRLVVAGAGKWAGIDVLRPPYGPRPNDANKRVWTDHYFVGAGLRVE